MARKATSIDVAQLAGVSQSTVSRTFSMDERITEETRQRVLWAARQLGYKPNALARSLITQSTGIIGIVMADMSAPFYPYVLEKFTRVLQGIGKQVMLFNITPEQEMHDALPRAMQYQVDGVIITSALLSSAMANECAERGIPVILFNRYIKSGTVSAVCCDNEGGARLAVDYLLERGHRRLAYISGKEGTSTNTDRFRGFTNRLKEHGINDWIHEPVGEYSYEAGNDGAKQVMSQQNPPDAIFCANDIMAMGALDALRFDMGLQVPNDVSLIGFDDIPQVSLQAYNLTTVRQQVDQMIATTVDLLMKKLDDEHLPNITHTVPAVIVERGTVRDRR